jgi:type I restriction enzyme R subunit
VEAGKAEDTPETLDTPGKRALYNNLEKDGEMPRGADRVAEESSAYGSTGDPVLNLALTIDETVKKVRPDGWRGVQAREQVIKAALYGILQDVAEVERVFLIIKAQKEY